MNYVDVSRNTLDVEWRQLAFAFGLDADNIENAVKEERGEPLSLADFSPAQLEEAREKTRNMIEPLLSRSMKLFFDFQAPNWCVTDVEIRGLAEAYTDVFVKHFPDFYANPIAQRVNSFVEDLGVEIKAMVRTWRLIKARDGISPKLPKKAKKASGSGSIAESNKNSELQNAFKEKLPHEL